MENRDEDHGSRSIGDLTARIVNSLNSSDSIPAAPATGSPTTGTRLPAPRASSSIGPRPGGTGAVARSSDLRSLLAGTDPEATDQAIRRLLPPSVASALSPVVRDFIDPVYGWDGELVAYRLDVEPDPLDLSRAAALFYDATAPASVAVIRESLALLRAATAGRAVAEDDLALTMQVMAEECAEYPPDVVRAACRRWGRREKWFPSLAELRDEMQRLGKRRQMMAAALR